MTKQFLGILNGHKTRWRSGTSMLLVEITRNFYKII